MPSSVQTKARVEESKDSTPDLMKRAGTHQKKKRSTESRVEVPQPPTRGSGGEKVLGQKKKFKGWVQPFTTARVRRAKFPSARSEKKRK